MIVLLTQIEYYWTQNTEIEYEKLLITWTNREKRVSYSQPLYIRTNAIEFFSPIAKLYTQNWKQK